MAGLNAGGDGRGVSQVVAVVLLIAVTVTLAVGAGALLTGTTEELHQPASADVSVSETTSTTSSECAGGSEPEVALDVTLSYLDRAESI
ncbi:MAG: archaellin/type IV pilin N-terminal domain-containing protein [Haloarculaceae archaeon]